MSDSNCDRPRLAITLGDPAGIGPEVILKALADPTLSQTYDLTVFGSRQWLIQTYEGLQRLRDQGLDPTHPLATQEWVNPQRLQILDPSPAETPIQLGQPSIESGAASFIYLEQAIAQTLAGEFQGIVTGPIAKSVWQQAGHHYAGQTELLAEKSAVQPVWDVVCCSIASHSMATANLISNHPYSVKPSSTHLNARAALQQVRSPCELP